MNNIPKPSWFLNLTEGSRAFFQFVKCIWFMQFYKFQSIGKKQPILVIPGLLGSDFSTGMLRKFLEKNDYEAYTWNRGRNLGNIKDLDFLTERIKELQQKHQQKIILIGWSLGGVYARELAKRNPELVKQIITLGSPFAALEAPNHAKWVFDLFNNIEDIEKSFRDQIPNPAPIPTTAIYSKSDGIVPWQACMEVPTATHNNIEVNSAHLGFCINTQVFTTLVSVLNNR
jgi:pimeloyl-ACP methyl ester carboxylesterase